MGKFWDEHIKGIAPERFRAENGYLGLVGYPYAEMVRHVEASPQCSWLYAHADEDGAFGCPTEVVDGKVVSRDLLDSIIEVEWLARHWALGPTFGATVLDIGAGYGRLAHRMATMAPTAKVYCTDTVPESREYCARYLAHRGIEPRVYAPGELDRLPPIDLAVNIHCWPECPRPEIHWWLDWLRDHAVPRIFCMPNGHTGELLQCLYDEQSFQPDIEARGYRLAHHWVGPACWPRGFWLFERVP